MKESWKRLIATFFVIVLALLIGFSSVFAGGTPTAQDYMESRMYPQAITLLKQQIQKSPKNAKAHYDLAICYVQTFRNHEADTSFERAVTLNPKLGLSIGNEYAKAGTFQLDRGNQTGASELFNKAMQYNPNLRELVGTTYRSAGAKALNRAAISEAKECFRKAISFDSNHRSFATNSFLEQGKRLLNRDEAKQAEEYFDGALSFSAEAKEQLCDIYFEQGKAVIRPSDFNLLERAKKYCSRHDEEILEIIIAKLPGETIRVEMGPDEVKDIATLNKGQRWRYIHYKGSFFHRIYKHEGTGWSKINNNLPWNADISGKLQTRSEQEKVTFIIKIENSRR